MACVGVLAGQPVLFCLKLQLFTLDLELPQLILVLLVAFALRHDLGLPSSGDGTRFGTLSLPLPLETEPPGTLLGCEALVFRQTRCLLLLLYGIDRADLIVQGRLTLDLGLRLRLALRLALRLGLSI